ncbi:MAG: hypothetical protein FJX03_05505 [Alphaproteobacteria bacterium]|nr:hypothetical protein [Alphaproteobacteria bacterium]
MIKKILLLSCFVYSQSQLYAAEELSATSAQAPNADEIMRLFRTDPTNFEKKGGLAGWLAADAPKEEAIKAYFEMLVQQNRDLRDQLNVSNGAAQNADAVRRALKETQDQLDRERAIREQKEHELIAQQEINRVVEKKRQELLSGLNNAKLLLTVEQQRKEEVEVKNRALKAVMSQIAAMVQEIEALESSTADLKESKNLPQEGTSEEISIRLGRITKIIEQNNTQLERLKSDKRNLEKRQIETESQIQALKQRIKENDYYAQILEMIKDRSISDEELTFRIICICTFLETNLDILSEGRTRLIEELLDHSLPRSERPNNIPNPLPQGYVELGHIENRFRYIGNDFGQELDWYGEPMDYSQSRHVDSPFEKKQGQVKNQAKEYIRSLNEGEKK